MELTLVNGTLDASAIYALMKLKTLNALQLIDVTLVASEAKGLAAAIRLHALSGLVLTTWTLPDSAFIEALESIGTKLICKVNHAIPGQDFDALARYGHLELLNLGESDIDTSHECCIHLCKRTTTLKQLICKSAPGDRSGRILSHLNVSRLTLTGAIDDIAIDGLAWNTTIESLMFVRVPLHRDWVVKLSSMKSLKTLFIRHPTPAKREPHLGNVLPPAPIDTKWLETKPGAPGCAIIFI
ncbi:hypothetical protein [Robbsia sp. KACC 23696]|uniref:hypothetical protein n=1 Tax=Robbsia sp. KACC 23696 TaxID=3149231 RepID=UPI00325C033F